MSASEHGVNVPLLRKTLEHITAHPEEWNQGYWALRGSLSPCGTAYCLAGHVVVETGYEIAWGRSNEAHTTTAGEFIDVVAADELGLDEVRADNLFDGSNSLRDLWQYASHYTNGEIEVPADLPGGTL